ncbi:MAG: hypothetical protein WCO84_01865 [bacterium]
MDILGKIFGSINRVKLFRLFFANPNGLFTREQISSKSKISEDNVLKELTLLTKAKFLKKKKFKGEKETKKLGKKKKAILVGWELNPGFKYLSELKVFLMGGEVLDSEYLIKKFKGAGKIRLIITAGVFMNDEKSRADLLVVGDNINKKSVSNVIKAIESEIGRELNYGVFETEDFKYRLTVYDKFVRDVIDFPHNKIFDKLDE